MRTLIALIVFSLCGCAGEAPGSSGGARLSVATETPDQVEAGRRIVEFQCTSCHGVRTDDKSHNPRAPALRTLAERYFRQPWPGFFTTIRLCLGAAAEQYLTDTGFQG